MPDSDIRDPAPPTPIDTVIGDLAAGRVIQTDRMRLGRTLDKANADASGHRAKAGEAFGRIVKYEDTAGFEVLSRFVGEDGARKAARVKYDISDRASGCLAPSADSFTSVPGYKPAGYKRSGRS